VVGLRSYNRALLLCDISASSRCRAQRRWCTCRRTWRRGWRSTAAVPSCARSWSTSAARRAAPPPVLPPGWARARTAPARACCRGRAAAPPACLCNLGFKRREAEEGCRTSDPLPAGGARWSARAPRWPPRVRAAASITSRPTSWRLRRCRTLAGAAPAGQTRSPRGPGARRTRRAARAPARCRQACQGPCQGPSPQGGARGRRAAWPAGRTARRRRRWRRRGASGAGGGTCGSGAPGAIHRTRQLLTALAPGLSRDPAPFPPPPASGRGGRQPSRSWLGPPRAGAPQVVPYGRPLQARGRPRAQRVEPTQRDLRRRPVMNRALQGPQQSAAAAPRPDLATAAQWPGSAPGRPGWGRFWGRPHQPVERHGQHRPPRARPLRFMLVRQAP